MAMHGIDTSSYQAGLNVGTAPVDFVVIKATEGTGYVNPHCDVHYQQAKGAGKLRGVYHFGANKANSPQEEAAYFVNNVKGYVGDGLLALDNENSTYHNEGDVAWALAWLQEVERLTGVKPLIYMNANCVNTHDWTPVINNGNALWVAAYQSNPPDVKWPNGSQTMWQFTSSYTIPGYSGQLDQNVFWGDAKGWGAYASKGVAPSPVPAPPLPEPSPTPPVVPVPVPPPTELPPTTPPPPVASPLPSQTLWEYISILLGKLIDFLKSFKRSN